MPIKLAFEAIGEGPPVVILHGLFGAGCNWMPVAESLAARYRVYLPDARNHGASPWSETMAYNDMALDVKVLIESEQLQRPFIVGHSMGGKTAMALALEHPDSIGGLAVIDIAPESYVGQFSSYVSAMRSLGLAAESTRRQLREVLAGGLGPRVSEDFLMQSLRRHHHRFDWRINLLATALCSQDLCSFPVALLDERYQGPALFLSGEESDYLRPESRPRILELFPDAQLERIPDAGHWLHADQPEALLCGLQEWLADASALAPR